MNARVLGCDWRGGRLLRETDGVVTWSSHMRVRDTRLSGLGVGIREQILLLAKIC